MATYRRSILFRLAADPIAWVWTGDGDLYVPPSDKDPAGATYLGLGAIIDIPALKALINGIADRVEFTLSGVTGEVLRLALEDRESIKDAAVDVGEISFDADWQQGDVVWVWYGAADVLSADSQETARGRQRTIKLSVRSADTFRANPVLAFFTDADQRKRSPTDAIFNQVARINTGVARRFGPFDS